MTKRKADIFTVVEAVPNWFVASHEVGSIQEATNSVVTHGVGTSSEVLSPGREALPPTAEISLNWVGSDLYTWKPAEVAESEASCAEADWAESNWTGPNLVPWAVASSHEGTTDWAGNRQRRQEPSEVARSGRGQVTHDLDSSIGEGSTEVEGVGQNAFWALLKNAGYEVW